MVPAGEWADTEIHKASKYNCGKCGERFASPEEVYAHLDAEHPKEGARR